MIRTGRREKQAMEMTSMESMESREAGFPHSHGQ